MKSTKLQVLKELISCNTPINYWLYDDYGHILERPDDARWSCHAIFLLSKAYKTMQTHFTKTDRPLVISIGIGVMWAAAMELDGKSRRFHVIGPIFYNAISRADILRNIKPLEDAGSLSIQNKREFMDFLYTLPVISYTMMLQYAIWLHYCVSGEKLTTADVATERSSHAVEHANRPPLEPDLHRTYMVERSLLQCVQNGDLDYKELWSKALQMEVFDKSYADSPLESKKISCVQFARLCAHYAALGGLPPAVGYNLEFSYVKSIQMAKNASALQSLQNEILDTFVQHVYQHKAASRQSVSQEIRLGCEYILQHIESDLALEDVSAYVNYTPYYFSRKFKREMGMSINQYIKIQKIERSKALLLTTNLSIQEIADKLSLCSPTYFSSAFRSLVGCSPTTYRTGRT